MPGGPWLSGIGNELVVGAAGGSQVILDSTLNIPVTTVMFDTGLPATDVTSISNITSAVRLPSGNPAEVNPPLIANVIITWSSGAKSDALLSLGGIYSGAGGAIGYFTLDVSSSTTDGAKTGGQITGMYNISGGTVTLAPRMVIDRNANVIVYARTIVSANVVTGTGQLVPPPENWHALALLNAWSNSTPALQYRALPLGINVVVEVIGDITHASIAGTSQVATLPASLAPSHQQVKAVDFVVATAGWAPAATWPPRLRLDTGGGLTLVDLPAGTTEVQFHALYSLDA